MAWFALKVRPQHEAAVERGLAQQGIEAYLPVQRTRRRWSDRVKELDRVLFPGYVFCRFSYSERMRVLQSPGVQSIVSAGKQNLTVDDEEIDALKALIASGRPLSVHPYLREGQRVIVREGPFASIRGVILRAKDAWRMVVSIEALNAAVAVELDAEVLAPYA